MDGASPRARAPERSSCAASPARAPLLPPPLLPPPPPPPDASGAAPALTAPPRSRAPRSLCPRAPGDGHINLREFRQALEFMGVYLTGTEFRKLWRQFDMSGDGKINYSEFNNKVRPDAEHADAVAHGRACARLLRACALERTRRPLAARS
jgi:hypothetical protein